MPNLPAICSNGHVYNSGIFVENAKNISFLNNKVKCPICGVFGSIPDGVYDIIGNSIKFLKGPDVSRSTLLKLKELLVQVKFDDDNILETSNKIREEIPELSSLSDILPKTRSDLYNFVSMLIALITLLLSLGNSIDNDPNQIINIINNNQTIINNNQTIIDKKTDSIVPKVGRNELCPCGSSKKYKHCHGKN